MAWSGEVLIDGAAQGEVLRLDAPISFWGGVDPATGRVTLAGHPQRGASVLGRILVVPQTIGSSSSSAVMLELLYTGRAPSGLILGARDAILPMGVVVARQMGWQSIPVLVLNDPPFQTGTHLSIASGGAIREL